MSGPSTMTCERCSELITELVCGELDASTAANVRAHAEACGHCGPELRSFSRVLRVAHELPLETPSAAVDQRIMQAARDALSRRAGGAQAMDPERPSVGGLKAWLERIANWAMSPQVAMASVLLLVVGIGLYALPFGHEGSAPTSLHLAQEPAPTAAPVATATGAPVREPVEESGEREALDQALAPAQEPVLPARGARAQAKAKAEAADAAERRRAKPRAEAKSASSTRRMEGLSERSGGAGKGAGGSIDDLLDSASVGRPAPKKQGSGGGYAPPPPPPAPASPSPSRVESAGAAPGSSANVGARGAAPAASAPAGANVELEAAPPAEIADDQANLLADGIRAARAGQHARAVSLLEPIAQNGSAQERTAARPWLARSLRAQGLCTRALPHYAELVRLRNVSPAILNEAADCYDKVGEHERAEALRARARPSETAAPKDSAPAHKE